jgi:hypothetical protein
MGRAIIVLLLLALSLSAGCARVGNKKVMLLSASERELVLKDRNGVAPPIRSREFKKETLEIFGLGPTREGEKRWDLKWSWERGISTPGKPSADNAAYDDDGNLIVAPEVVNTYKIPDLHAGIAYDFTADKIRTLLEVEVLEIKVPRLRWLSTGVVASNQYLGVHLSKRWTSIFEVETGIILGHDFDIDKTTTGLAGLVIKF